MSIDAILMADHLVRHMNTFGSRSPGVNDRSPQAGADDKKSFQTGAEEKESPEVILDPVQNLRMVLKLIEQLMGFLRDLARSWETRASAGPQAAAPTDFAPRYFTTASRDLHRAVEWYAHLKERNL
jgi:hypothetical protein